MIASLPFSAFLRESAGEAFPVPYRVLSLPCRSPRWGRINGSRSVGAETAATMLDRILEPIWTQYKDQDYYNRLVTGLLALTFFMGVARSWPARS